MHAKCLSLGEVSLMPSNFTLREFHFTLFGEVIRAVDAITQAVALLHFLLCSKFVSVLKTKVKQ